MPNPHKEIYFHKGHTMSNIPHTKTLTNARGFSSLLSKTLLFGSVFALSMGIANAAPYAVDKAHSSVGFSLSHMVISEVKGAFNEFDGSVDFDPAKKTLTALKGEINTKSVDTNNKGRDEHLRKPDFFDVKKFPKATLEMKSIKGKKLTADVTIRGITKPVVFDYEVKGPVENEHSKKQMIAIKLEGKLNRKDFEVGKDTSNASVGEEVKVSIQIEAQAQ